MGNSIPVPRIYRTIGFAGQKVTSGREGGQWAYFSWDFMVRIQVTINSTSRTAEEDFIHRFVFSPLPPPLRFRRERLLSSFRSSSSAVEIRVRKDGSKSQFSSFPNMYVSNHLSRVGWMNFLIFKLSTLNFVN